MLGRPQSFQFQFSEWVRLKPLTSVTYLGRKLFLKVATNDITFQDCYFGPDLVDSKVTKFYVKKVRMDCGKTVVAVMVTALINSHQPVAQHNLQNRQIEQNQQGQHLQQNQVIR